MWFKAGQLTKLNLVEKSMDESIATALVTRRGHELLHVLGHENQMAALKLNLFCYYFFIEFSMKCKKCKISNNLYLISSVVIRGPSVIPPDLGMHLVKK